MRKFEQLTHRLRSRLISAGEKGDGRLPTLSAIAKQEGFSLNTVHHAIQELKKEGLIVTRAGRGTFLAHSAPFSSESEVVEIGNERKALPVLLLAFMSGIHHVIEDPIGGILLKGLEKVFAEEGRGRAIQFHAGVLKERLVPVRIERDAVCGMICVAPYSTSYLSSLAAQANLIVSVDRDATPWGIDSIVTDNIAGALLATTHLLNMGHRQIAYLGSSLTNCAEPYADPAVAERLRGFKLAFMTRGLKPDMSLCQPLPDLVDIDKGIDDLFASGMRYSAIIAYDENVAARLLPRLKAKGLRVPADVSLLHAGTAEKERTNIGGPCFDVSDIGRQSWNLLTRPRKGGQRAGPELVMLPATFVPKESTARPSKSARNLPRNS